MVPHVFNTHAHVNTRQGHTWPHVGTTPIAPVPVLAGLRLCLGWGAQQGWGGPDTPQDSRAAGQGVEVRMMMGSWVGWSLPGEDGGHLGESPHRHGMVPCLGGMLGFRLEKTPWPQQRGFGSGPELLARTVRGWWGSEKHIPPRLLSGTAHRTAALNSPCRASSRPATPKRASERVVDAS